MTNDRVQPVKFEVYDAAGRRMFHTEYESCLPTEKEILAMRAAGYNSKSPTATLRVHLTLGKGVQEWGAEPYKDYYILQILEVQKIENWSQEASK